MRNRTPGRVLTEYMAHRSHRVLPCRAKKVPATDAPGLLSNRKVGGAIPLPDRRRRRLAIEVRAWQKRAIIRGLLAHRPLLEGIEVDIRLIQPRMLPEPVPGAEDVGNGHDNV